jgi:hypothetical protein
MGKKCCVIPLDYETMETMTEFVMLTELGFFTLTGQRYQMMLPARDVDVEAVRAAASKIAETEDEDFMIHPERFITAMRRVDVDADAWSVA